MQMTNEQAVSERSMTAAKMAALSEKKFIKGMAASILSILLCMFAMAFGAYAHFTNEKEASATVIRSAEYVLDWDITVNGETTKNGRIVCPDTDGLPKDYEIKMTLSAENTAATGFCVIDIYEYAEGYITRENATPKIVLHTVQIGEDVSIPGGRRTTLTFTITVTSPAVITFTPNWGTSGNYNYDNANSEFYVEEGEKIEVSFPTPAPPAEEPNPHI